MVVRKLSAIERSTLKCLMHYGVNDAALAQGLYDLFLQGYQDQSEAGQAEQIVLLTQLSEILLQYINLIIESLEARKKASAQEDRIFYDSTDPADVMDEHYLSALTMYGQHWMSIAHTAVFLLLEHISGGMTLTAEEFESCIEIIRLCCHLRCG